MIAVRSAVLLILVGSLGALRSEELSMAGVTGILVEMDSGDVMASVSNQGNFRFSASSGGGQLSLMSASKTEGTTLVIRVPFKTPPTPTQLSIEVPKSIPLTIVGHSASVRAEGFESRLTVRTFSGDIAVVNAIGPTSLDSDLGHIHVDIRSEPKADFHVQSDSGTVDVAIDDGLSLRAVLRGGKTISWGTGAQTKSGALDRSLGSGGPIVYVASRIADVKIRLVPSELAVADSEKIFRSDANWVYMNVIVKDLKGRTIPELEQERFIVTDDGSPVELGHFEKTTEPFHLLLLFDVSASIAPHVGLIRAAATRFIEHAQKGDEIAIATFSSSVRLIQPFTPDVTKAEKALEAIKPAGETAIYDAVYSTVTDYMKEAAGRKAIVLFTDGIDNSLFGKSFGSSHSFESLLRVVKDSDCLIYPIFVQPVPEKRQLTSDPTAPSGSLTEQRARANGPNPQLYCGSETNRSQTATPCPFDGYQIIALGKKHLQQLAEETGGAFRGLNDMTNLADAYSQIANDLTTVYTIGFTVKFIDADRWHPLKVRIRDTPIGTLTRTRGGYFSPPAKK